jgi:hypothetical protein
MTVCTLHGGGSPQAVNAASARLTIAELSRDDARPVKQVIADAVRLADLNVQDSLNALQNGEVTADSVARALECARYSASLAQLALQTGALSLDEESDVQAAAVDAATALVAGWTLDVLAAALSALLPVHNAHDVQHRQAWFDWSRDALVAKARGDASLPAVPAVAVAEIAWQPAAKANHGSPDVVDVDIVDDGDIDEDLPGDAELIAEWERLTGRTYSPEAVL